MKKILYIIIICFLFPWNGISAEVFPGPGTISPGDGNVQHNPDEGEDATMSGAKWTARELFGRKRGYLHASLMITGIYTDNAFNTSDNRKSSFTTVFSPKIWLALPGIRQKPPAFQDISTRSPGGSLFSRFDNKILRRYQAYLVYRADIPSHSGISPSGNTDSHKLYSRISYNSRIIDIDLINQFTISYVEREAGVSTTEADAVDKFRSNSFNAAISYDIGRKLRLGIDYSNFMLDYDAQRNMFRDRSDNAFISHLFYKFSPKTALFAEYDFIDINYPDNSVLNSREHHFWGGLKWDITAKSKGTLKAGYGRKNFIGSPKKTGNFLFETQIKHKFTPKTSIKFTAVRKTRETSMETSLFMLTSGTGMEYQQMLTARTMGFVKLSYTDDKYKGDLTLGGETDEREDNTYKSSLGFQYKFRERVENSIVYTHTKRDSNFSDFSYSGNTILFSIKASF